VAAAVLMLAAAGLRLAGRGQHRHHKAPATAATTLPACYGVSGGGFATAWGSAGGCVTAEKTGGCVTAGRTGGCVTAGKIRRRREPWELELESHRYRRSGVLERAGE
jgi:hypothetical protein